MACLEATLLLVFLIIRLQRASLETPRYREKNQGVEMSGFFTICKKLSRIGQKRHPIRGKERNRKLCRKTRQPETEAFLIGLIQNDMKSLSGILFSEWRYPKRSQVLSISIEIF